MEPGEQREQEGSGQHGSASQPRRGTVRVSVL